MPDLPRQMLIVGVGLIGGSLALRLQHTHPEITIVGAGRCVETLRQAQQRGAIDRYVTDLSQAAVGADMVVLAVPMAAMRSVMAALRPGLGNDVIITDTGSVKSSFIADADAVFGRPAPSPVVPGHPIAGSENSGIAAASATLFDGHRVILTPTAATDPAAVATVRLLWQQCGASIETMDAGQHDHILAATSHLPHILAYALVDTLLALPERQAILRYAAGGFRDFSRIASSDPTMWRDICLKNQQPLLALIDQLQQHIAALRDLVAAGDGTALHAVFARSKAARDQHYQ